MSDIESVLEGHAPSNIIHTLSGEEFFISLQSEADFLRAFNICPPLKAITSKRAKLTNTGTFELLNTNNGNYAKGEDARKAKALLNKPNALQTSRQFFAQHNMYIDVFGYCPVLGIEAKGFEGEYTSIWNVPPWLFDLRYHKQWLGQTKTSDVIREYRMMWENGYVVLNLNNLHLILDDGIGTQYDMNLIIPDSRLVGLDYVISNISAAYKSRNTLITKRGAIGILSNAGQDTSGPVVFKAGERDQIQKDFGKYGIVGQPFQIIITEAALKWQQMGYATRDLMLFEEVDESINFLCDAYGYPPELLARTKGVTFDNKAEAVKSVYRDTVIPESSSRMEQFSPIVIRKDRENFVVTRDFTNVPILQENKKSQADALKALNDALVIEYENDLITRNDWREMIGLDRITGDPTFDMYKSQVAEAKAAQRSGNGQGTAEDVNVDEEQPIAV